MKMFYKKGRSSIVLMVVLAMLLQIVGPVVGDYVYALGEEEGFKVIKESPIEDGKVTIDWEFTLDPNNSKDSYEYNSNFTLKEGKEPQALIGEDENGNEVEIGRYRISEDGKITVDIHEELYEVFEEVVGPEIEETPLPSDDEKITDIENSTGVNSGEDTPKEEEASKNETSTNDEAITDETKDEEIKDKEVNNEEPNLIGKTLATLAFATEDIGGLLEGNKGENEVKIFNGSITVLGATPKKSAAMPELDVNFLSETGRDLSNIEGFHYDFKFYSGETELTDPINIENLGSLDFVVKFDINDNIKFTNGDYLEVDISDLLELKEFNPPEDIKDEESITSGSDIVGKYLVTEDKKLRLEFNGNESYNTKIGRKGEASIGFEINPVSEEVPIVEVIEFKGKETKTFTIIRKTFTGSPILKTGRYDSTKDRIIWTIEVNTDLKVLENVKVEDTIDSRLEIETINIYNLDIVLDNGNYKKSRGSEDNIQASTNNQTITVTWNELKGKAKEIEIVTKLANAGDLGNGEHGYKSKVENTASLYIGSSTTPTNAPAKVNFNRVSLISKEAKFVSGSSNKVIEWTITYWGNGEETANIKDTLTLPENVGLILTEAKVGTTDATYTIEDTTIEFTNLPNDSGTHYELKYKTELIYNDASIRNSSLETKISNKAILNSDPTLEASTSIGIVRGNFLSKESIGQYGIGTETFVDWKITVNGNGEKWKEVEIKEYIPNGFEFAGAKIGSVPILEYDSSSSQDKYYKKITVDPSHILINLGTVHQETEVIVTTKLTNPEALKSDVKNRATIHWKPYKDSNFIGTGNWDGEITSSEITDTISAGSYESIVVKSTTSPKISDDIGDITKDNAGNSRAGWKVIYESFNKSIADHSIKDELTDSYGENHFYDKDSFKVKIANGTATQIEVGDNKTVTIDSKEFIYTLKLESETSVDSNKFRSFTFEVISGDAIANTQYNKIELTYDTKFNLSGMAETVNKDTKMTLTNKATVIYGTGTNDKVEKTASQSIHKTVSYNGKKTGKYDTNAEGRVFEWQAELNHKGKSISSITDTLSEYQKYILKSNGEVDIKIYKAKLQNSDGGATLVKDGEDPISGYTVSVTSKIDTNGDSYDEKMTIEFNTSINHPIIIKYKTEAVGISKQNYSNKLSFNGKEYIANAEYKKYNRYIDKSAVGKTDKVIKGDVLQWELDINTSLSQIHVFEMTDKMPTGMTFITGSLEVYESGGTTPVFTSKNYNPKAEDNKFELTENAEGFTLSSDYIDKKYIVKYKSLVNNVAEGSMTNTVQIDGEEWTQGATGGKEYTLSARRAANFTGQEPSNENEYLVQIEKVDNQGNSISAGEAKFLLTIKTEIDGVKYDEITEELTTVNRKLEFALEKNDYNSYTIQELEAPNGYVPNNGEVIEINLEKDSNGKRIAKLIFKNTKKEDATGSITFFKVGEDKNNLKGAEFTLYKESDNSVVKAATSDENGLVKFEGVSNGNYIIKETNPPEGYVLNTTSIEIEIDIKRNGETIELDDIVNEIVKGNIKFTKHGKYLDEDKKPLVGAEFMIYKVPYNEGDDPIVPAVKSNLEGIVEFKNIPYGKYVIVENDAPNGYLKSTAQIPVTIEKDGFTVELTEEDESKLINTRIDADIQVKKFGEGDNPPALKGAKFELIQGDDVKYESKTAEDGTEIFKNVEFGTYKLRESKAPEGYNLSDKTCTVVVEEHRDETLVFEYFNTKIRGNIKLQKVGESGEGLKNAEFSIYKSTDTDFENVVVTATSNKDGEVLFEDIAYGDYKIKETTAPEGYNLSTKVLDAKIETQGQEVDLIADPVSNTKIRGNIKILKRDRNTHSPLKDATIGLYSVIDVLIDEKISGDDGLVKFDNLEYGQYYFKEIKAPAGYILDNTKYYFEITKNGETLERNLDNTRRYYPPGPGPDPTYPPTGPERPTDPKPPVVPPTDPTKPVDPVEPTDPEEPVEIQEVSKEPNGPTIKEETPKDTPKEGEIEVPEGSTPKVNNPPTNGTVTIDPNGKWTYTPNPGFVGKDSFTIIITHPDGTEEEIFVEIDVDEPPLGNIEDGGSTLEESVKTLPKTGSIGRLGFYISGLLFMILGIFIVRRKTE